MLKYKKARRILYDVNFPGDSDPTYLLSIAPKQERRDHLSGAIPIATRQIAAAIEIQRVWRGYCARYKLRRILSSKVSHSITINPNESDYPRIYDKFRQKYPDHGGKHVVSGGTSTDTMSLHNYAAQTIQSWWRRHKTRAPHALSDDDTAAAGDTAEVVVPASGRRPRERTTEDLSDTGVFLTSTTGAGVADSTVTADGTSLKLLRRRARVTRVTDAAAHQRKPKEKLTVKAAAIILQRAWRRHNDMKVFDFYRELINFRGRGDPGLMLKSINPKEAQLLDKAAGVHVRFRLGGVKFPPNIYYKIFTRRPVIDLCASSPRDYTAMAYRQQLARDRHNKQPRIPAGNDRCGWYKRCENNGWRLVSDRFFLSPYQDNITIESNSERLEFHHSKLQRRQDVMKKQKRRKVEWLRKMYREGMLEAKEEVGNAEVQLASEVMSMVEQQHVEQVMEQDIDDLLGWTNALNFDEYITDWYSIASSGFSDENHDINPSQDDRYEVTVTLSNRK